MTLSYVLIFVLALVLLIAVFASYNHVFKSALSCLISSAILVGIIYIDYSFNQFGIYKSLFNITENLLSGFMESIGRTDNSSIYNGVVLFCSFYVTYLIIGIIIKVSIVNKKQPKKLSSRISHVIFILMYFAFFGSVYCIFTVLLGSAFMFEDGFLDFGIEIIRGVRQFLL